MTDTPPQPMNLNAFVFDLVTLYREHDCMDMDGGDIQGMLVKHGLMIERPATEDDLEDESLRSFGVEPGDVILVYAEEFVALRSQIQE